MNTTRIHSFVYYLLLFLLILFSFYNFAEIYFPLLNSDMAITVLMAQNLNLPGDLYFWGQDRAGSLIPLLANILVEAYKFPPVLAVSVIHYLILIAGFFALASFFRNRNLKLILALIWFFPSWHFLDQVNQLFGIQMCLIAIALYFLKIMQVMVNRYLQLVWLSLACLSFLTAIWVSDLALVSLGLIALIVTWKYQSMLKKKRYLFFFKDRNTLLQVVIVAAWFILGTAFILYAKHKATRTEAYHINHLNHPGEIYATLKIIFYSIWRVFIFASENLMESIYAWAIVAGIPLVISLSNTRNHFLKFCSSHKWLIFFALNGIVTFVLLVLSHWVYLNGTPRRYFTLVYISLWIAMLLYVESTGSRNRQLRMIILVIVVLFGAISSFSKFFVPERLPSRLTAMGDFRKLGDFGLISDYWDAYLIASVDPKHIIATPHDKDDVKNHYLPELVFKMPKLYLARDGWMDSFPDTITQFGHILSRKGSEFVVASIALCQYERVYYKRKFSCEEMQHQGTVSTDPLTGSGKSVVIGKDFDRKKHFIYGPFLSLQHGTILVQYSLKSEPDLNTRTIAVLEISAEYGKKVLATQAIHSCDFQSRDKYQFFDLKTTLDKDYKGVEFRIMYLGGPDL
ncbi:MAG TPA: hypothetical protein VFE66_08535, partial [Bacteroidales bacterium]|nr:hypothetical protein [Bacteroidales bacterium]